MRARFTGFFTVPVVLSASKKATETTEGGGGVAPKVASNSSCSQQAITAPDKGIDLIPTDTGNTTLPRKGEDCGVRFFLLFNLECHCDGKATYSNPPEGIRPPFD